MKLLGLLLLLLFGCAKKDAPTPTSTLTPAEQPLLGKWKLVSIVNTTKYVNGSPSQVYPGNFQGSPNYIQFNADNTWHELIGYDYDGTFTYQPPVLTYFASQSYGALKKYNVTLLTTNDLVVMHTDSTAYQGHTDYYNIQVRTYAK